VVTMHDLTKFSLQELTDYIGQSTPGGGAHDSGMAELARRQYVATLEATAAQKAAADAARSNATYVLWSVGVAALAALAAAVSAIVAAYSVLHPR
jgi:hypothetical protein